MYISINFGFVSYTQLEERLKAVLVFTTVPQESTEMWQKKSILTTVSLTCFIYQKLADIPPLSLHISLWCVPNEPQTLNYYDKSKNHIAFGITETISFTQSWLFAPFSLYIPFSFWTRLQNVQINIPMMYELTKGTVATNVYWSLCNPNGSYDPLYNLCKKSSCLEGNCCERLYPTHHQ